MTNGRSLAALVLVLSLASCIAYRHEPAPLPPPPPPPPPPVQQRVVLPGVHFDYGKADIAPDEVNRLEETAAILKERPDLTFEIAGYTDPKGGERYNQKLSARRAEAVAGYLQAQGVPPTQTVIVGHGELDPVTAGDTAEGRAADRRVEIRLAEKQPYETVRVFYGTDRAITTPFPALAYGGETSEMSYGIADVSIPHDHRMGRIERPRFWEFRENPERHVIIMHLTPESSADFLSGVASRVTESESKSAFVFVHGYNVEFPDAVRRTAQLAYDLGFDGAPILYSWPSQGTFLAYPADETSVERTIPHLRDFLAEVAARTGAQTVHLIAHSMGNRALGRALGELIRDRPPGIRRIFHDVILAAPDIDAEVFRTQIAPAIVGTDARITLYASSADQALQASKRFHGGVARAGDAGPNLLVINGIDTIDASTVRTDFLAHSYIGDSRSVISDVFQLVRNGLGPAKRPGLSQQLRGRDVYWAFRP